MQKYTTRRMFLVSAKFSLSSEQTIYLQKKNYASDAGR